MVQTINNGVHSAFDNDNSHFFCCECNGPIISDDFRGDTVCEDCGLIHSEKEIDIENFSKNIYNPQKIYREVTSFLYLPGISYATKITDLNQYPQFQRLIKIDSWFKTSKNQSEISGIGEIKRICYNLQIPFPTMVMAIRFFKKTCRNGYFKGYSRDVRVACCIYYVCRKRSIVILYHEIIDQNSVPENAFRKFFSFFMRTFNLKLLPLSPRELLPKFIHDLGLNLEFEKKTKYRLDMISKSYQIGKNPRGICAGALYLTSLLLKQKILQKDIAKACYISDATLRYTYKELKEIIYP